MKKSNIFLTLAIASSCMMAVGCGSKAAATETTAAATTAA